MYRTDRDRARHRRLWRRHGPRHRRSRGGGRHARHRASQVVSDQSPARDRHLSQAQGEGHTHRHVSLSLSDGLRGHERDTRPVGRPDARSRTTSTESSTPNGAPCSSATSPLAPPVRRSTRRSLASRQASAGCAIRTRGRLLRGARARRSGGHFAGCRRRPERPLGVASAVNGLALRHVRDSGTSPYLRLVSGASSFPLGCSSSSRRDAAQHLKGGT